MLCYLHVTRNYYTATTTLTVPATTSETTTTTAVATTTAKATTTTVQLTTTEGQFTCIAGLHIHRIPDIFLNDIIFRSTTIHITFSYE